MHGNELRLVWAKAFLQFYYLCRASDIAAVGIIFNVLSYDALSDRDYNLSPFRRIADALRVELRSRVSAHTITIG